MPRVLAGRRRLVFGLLVTNGAAQAALAVATGWFVRLGFDALSSGRAAPAGGPSPEPSLGVATLVVAVLLGAAAWLRWRGHVDAERLGQSYVHALRKRLFRHIIRVGSSGLAGMSRGSVTLRFVGDLSAVRQWVSLGLARLTVSGTAAALAIVGLLVVEPVVAVAVAAALILAGSAAYWLGPRLKNAHFEARRRRGRLAAVLHDRVCELAVIDAFGQQRRERRRFERLSRALRDALVRRARVVGLVRAVNEINSAGTTLSALLVGAAAVRLGLASPGSVVSAMVVANLLAPRLQDLGRVFEYWNAYLVARSKQEQLLGRTRPWRHGPKRALPESFRPAIDLDQVGINGILSAATLHIEPGERISVRGPNGAGKSTLLRVLAGLVPADSGEVRLGGLPIHELRRRDLRAVFAFVSPDLPLLRGTLGFNLRYGASRSLAPARREAIIEHSGLGEIIGRHPDRLAQRLSEGGRELSTGERARIMLARALLCDPRVLLLDEADANLDDTSREAISEALEDFAGTVIQVSHGAGIRFSHCRRLRL